MLTAHWIMAQGLVCWQPRARPPGLLTAPTCTDIQNSDPQIKRTDPKTAAFTPGLPTISSTPNHNRYSHTLCQDIQPPKAKSTADISESGMPKAGYGSAVTWHYLSSQWQHLTVDLTCFMRSVHECHTFTSCPGSWGWNKMESQSALLLKAFLFFSHCFVSFVKHSCKQW